MRHTWKASATEHRGQKQVKMEIWMRNFYELHKYNPYLGKFTLEQLMSGCGMDVGDVPDYHAAMGYLTEQRRKLADAMEDFFGGKDYQKYKDLNLTNDEMFARMMRNAVYFNVFPVMSAAPKEEDEPRFYRLMSLKDFVRAMERRRDCIITEVDRKARMLNTLSTNLPEAALQYHSKSLELDGVFQHKCSKCGKSFSSQDILVMHRNKHHKVGK